MARTDQLGAPASTVYVDGENTLHRYWLHAASVATGIAPANVYGVQQVTPGAVTWKKTYEAFQQGGGERLNLKFLPEYTVDVQMFAANVPAFLAAITNTTFAQASGYYALPLVFEDWPLITWEQIYRQSDNATVVGSMIFQDLKLKEFNFQSNNENNIITIPFYSNHAPLYVDDSAQPVFDKFSGDGSTTAFTLSQTPLPVTDVSEGVADCSDFVLDNLIFCKVKTSTQNYGVRQKSGISVTGTTLTFTTAPAASTEIEVFYLCAVS